MKRAFIITTLFFLTSAGSTAFAQEQQDTLPPVKPDTGHAAAVHADTSKRLPQPVRTVVPPKPRPKVPQDSIAGIRTDHTIQDSAVALAGTPADSVRADTAKIAAPAPLNPESFVTNKVLARNRFLNYKEPSVYFIQEKVNLPGREFLFYSMCAIVLILGIFKTFNQAYFQNLFRVYFNTSLRQTQLTDQLTQARLPSFILNIFFSIVLGMYIWLLFGYYRPPRLVNNHYLLPVCMITVALLYFFKFCILKFTGWVSDISAATDHYIFAIFLVNKITGIVLVPVIIIMAFVKPSFMPVVINISFMLLGLAFLSRYIKSYSVIDKKIPLNLFHLIIYIAGAEIIPLILLYKIAVDYLI